MCLHIVASFLISWPFSIGPEWPIVNALPNLAFSLVTRNDLFHHEWSMTLRKQNSMYPSALRLLLQTLLQVWSSMILATLCLWPQILGRLWPKRKYSECLLMCCATRCIDFALCCFASLLKGDCAWLPNNLELLLARKTSIMHESPWEGDECCSSQSQGVVEREYLRVVPKLLISLVWKTGDKITIPRSAQWWHLTDLPFSTPRYTAERRWWESIETNWPFSEASSNNNTATNLAEQLWTDCRLSFPSQ